MGSVSSSTTFKYAFNIIDPNTSHYNYLIQDYSIRICSPSFLVIDICKFESGKLKGDHLSSFFPSISINGVTYTDVYKFHFTSNYCDYSSGYFYMKIGVGIIKQELYTKGAAPKREVFELVRYKIK